MEQQAGIARDFGAAFQAGRPVDGDEVQDITRRQVEWLSITMTVTKAYVENLGEMYVADPRFRANYDGPGGEGTAEFVRDAMKVYAQRHLSD
ncbi:TipAS antibiotic-recognition domain-containing protein [Luedemannella flava]